MTGGEDGPRLGRDLVGRVVLVEFTLDELRRRYGGGLVAEASLYRTHRATLLSVDGGFALMGGPGGQRWVNLACVASMEPA